MCEGYLLDIVPEFELELGKVRSAVDDYRQQFKLDEATRSALTVAAVRFMTQAQTLTKYYHRHNSSSQTSAADGLAFVEGFRSLQLKVVEESEKFRQFLTAVEQ
jgi:hypothetical protein